MPGTVMHAYNHGTLEAETRRSPWVQNQKPGLQQWVHGQPEHSKTQPQKIKMKNGDNNEISVQELVLDEDGQKIHRVFILYRD